jgi:hypothetical protein
VTRMPGARIGHADLPYYICVPGPTYLLLLVTLSAATSDPDQRY